METTVEALSGAYEELVSAVAGVLEAREFPGGQKAAAEAALENFKDRWELFSVACDRAEEFVESTKQRIGSECLVDEATGMATGKEFESDRHRGGGGSIPPISAVRLEQMSKAVRWLVIELQQGSGGAAAGGAGGAGLGGGGTAAATGSSSHLHHSPVPFDARFSEDAPP